MGICRSYFVVRHSRFHVPHWSFFVHRSSFVVRRSSFIVRRLPFDIFRSSFLVPHWSVFGCHSLSSGKRVWLTDFVTDPTREWIGSSRVKLLPARAKKGKQSELETPETRKGKHSPGNEQAFDNADISSRDLGGGCASMVSVVATRFVPILIGFLVRLLFLTFFEPRRLFFFVETRVYKILVP